MDLDRKSLISFLSVAEFGSFRATAARMAVGQSAVSRRIMKLEEGLGVSLFERKSTGVRLTPAGRCFAERARAIVDDLKAAVDVARSEGRGEIGYLRVGIIASLSRGPIRKLFQTFVSTHERVDLCVYESDRSELLTMLSHRRIDLLVASGYSTSKNLDSIVLAQERVFVAVPSDGKLAARASLKWSDVHDATFVVSTREPGPEIHDYVVRNLSGLGRKIQSRRHLLGREGIMTLVGLGFGISLVADHWRGVQYPNVTFMPLGDSDETVPFSITWRPENDNPALRRFISLARIEARKNDVPS